MIFHNNQRVIAYKDIPDLKINWKLLISDQLGYLRPARGVAGAMHGLQLNIVQNHHASIYPYTQVMCSWSLDLIFKAKLKLEFGNWKIQYGCQAAILKVTLLKINRLLPIYTISLLLKFRLDNQSQTEVKIWKLKNPIWPPGSHLESDIAKNQHASFHTHK